MVPNVKKTEFQSFDVFARAHTEWVKLKNDGKPSQSVAVVVGSILLILFIHVKIDTSKNLFNLKKIKFWENFTHTSVHIYSICYKYKSMNKDMLKDWLLFHSATFCIINQWNETIFHNIDAEYWHRGLIKYNTDWAQPHDMTWRMNAIPTCLVFRKILSTKLLQQYIQKRYVNN